MDEKERMLYLFKRNTLYTNPYFDKVITWSLNPQKSTQPPIDYILALINQARERIEALSINRELTLQTLKSVPGLTDDRIWANINHGLRLLPEHDPEIDDMTGTFVEITEHVRGLKDLIWRLECVIRDDPDLVDAYVIRPRGPGLLDAPGLKDAPQKALVRLAAIEAARFAVTLAKVEMIGDVQALGLGMGVDGWVDVEMERDNKERREAKGGYA